MLIRNVKFSAFLGVGKEDRHNLKCFCHMSHALGVTVRTDFDVTVLCFVILYPNFPHFVTDPAKSLNFAKAQLYLTSCIGA